MGYDLIPKNKKAKDLTIGAFSWPTILQETGAGYVVGYGAGRSPGTYVYVPDKRGASPASNDGYKVTASQAKMMAVVCRGYLSVKRFINKSWEDMDSERREHEMNSKTLDGKEIYKKPIGEEFLEKVEKFAEFAEASGGFSIH